MEEEEKKLQAVINTMINSVGNLVHESVPNFKEEQFNVVERTWGEELPRIQITGKLGGLHHH